MERSREYLGRAMPSTSITLSPATTPDINDPGSGDGDWGAAGDRVRASRSRVGAVDYGALAAKDARQRGLEPHKVRFPAIDVVEDAHVGGKGRR